MPKADPPANKAMKIIAGTVVAGRYVVTREIGRGGMAHVYEAKHQEIGKRVAVKVLAAEFTSSPVVVERFLREARAAAAVRSPYICDVYDSGKLEDGRPFLVMELLEGESLYERMVRIRQFDAKTTVRIITHVARGLAKAHAANIVHRDLKPENIFITQNEDGEMTAKILDFGLAKFYAPVSEGPQQARLTREGAIFGTPAYMSPEQVQGQGAVDSRADVWALGCIAYECLTGRTVWSTDKGIAMTFAQIASAELPQITKYRPDLPPAVDAWFARALSRSLDERYQTAKELADGFAAALEEGTPSVVTSGDVALDRLGSEDEEERGPTSSGGPVSAPRASGSRSTADALVSGPPSGRTVAAPAPEVGARPEIGATNSVTDVRPPDIGQPAAPMTSQAQIAAASREPSLAAGTAPLPLVSIPPPKKSSTGAVAAALVVALGIGGVAAWQIALRGGFGTPHPAGSSTPSAQASSAPAASSSSPAPLPLEAPPPPGPKWAALVAEAQAKLAGGDLDEAQKKFKEAFESGGSGIARTLAEHASAAATNKGPCKVTGLARLRPVTEVGGTVGRPEIVKTPNGFVALWADDHESAGHEHAYALLLDPAMRALAVPIDVTPEVDRLGHFDAKVVGDKIVLVYTERSGSGSGLYLRWLDGFGRIVGPPTSMSSAKAGASTPSIAVDGQTVWGAWDEKQEMERIDLMLRKLVPGDGRPPPNAVRVVDLRKGKTRPKLFPPEIGAANGGIEIAFRVDRDTQHPIQDVHVTDDASLIDGLPALSTSKDDRFLGVMKTLGTPTDKADTPTVSCAKDACFATWHVERGPNGGAYAAFIESKSGQMIWKKRFAPNGARPAVGAFGDGAARVVWAEQGRLKTATITRDGIGVASTIARIAGDQPPASIAMGADANEWAVAWQDFEAGHIEPYAVHLTCK